MNRGVLILVLLATVSLACSLNTIFGAGGGDVSGRVWLDTDGNGLLDENDPPATGTVVTLFMVDEDGELNLQESQTVGSSGEYSFQTHGVGSRYVVEFTPPEGSYSFILNNEADTNQEWERSPYSHVESIDADGGAAWSMEFVEGSRTVNAGLVPASVLITPTPTLAAALPEQTPTPGAVSGIYSCRIRTLFDDASHAIYVGMQEELDLNIKIGGGNLFIDGQSPFVSVTGLLQQSKSTFQAMGSGTVAGFSDIEVNFEGTLSDSGLEGEYGMGVGGGLPQGEPIIFGVECDPPTATVNRDMLPDIQALYGRFSTAMSAGDVDALLADTHPIVLDHFGEEACRSYFEQTVQNPISVDALDNVDSGAWAWELPDGEVINVDLAYTVEIRITLPDGSITDQQAHVAMDEAGEFRFFTVCADQ